MAVPNFIPFHSTLILNASSNGNSLHFTSLNRSFRHLPFSAQAPFAKNCAGPAARGSIPLPSLRCGLPAACALAPLADGSRLSLRLKAALPALFPLRPLTAPDHPPLKKSQSNFIPTQKPIPIQFEINIFSKNKKENAKIAPFQALRQGQALRVCYTKISTPRFASGRIIVQVSAEANLFDYAERSR